MIADISDLVSDSSVYTPEMIEEVVDIRKGDILVIKTGWIRYGWYSQDFGRIPLHGQASGTVVRLLQLVRPNGNQMDRRGLRVHGPSDEHHHAHLAPQDF